MNILATILMGVIAIGSYFFPQASVWDKIPATFGSISYPASLDSLVNPGATDSVATVSHSAQHSNANDAIEALEAKLGITSSSAVANSFLVGTGAGSSIWSTYASGTQAYFQNFFATGSSTLQNFTFNNATGTAATTTYLASTYASSTNLTGGFITGFGLSSCNNANFLTWINGRFGCESGASGGNAPIAGVSASGSGTYYASTTSISSGQVVRWDFDCGHSQSTDANTRYKLSNFAASSSAITVGANSGSTVKTNSHAIGIFTSTTTGTITVEGYTSAGCDNGSEFTVMLFR